MLKWTSNTRTEMFQFQSSELFPNVLYSKQSSVSSVKSDIHLLAHQFNRRLRFRHIQGCSVAGTRGNGVPTPFSRFALK